MEKAIYTLMQDRKGGTDLHVFDTEAECFAWKLEQAKEGWKNQFSNEITDEDDEEIVDFYYENISLKSCGDGEYWTENVITVEFPEAAKLLVVCEDLLHQLSTDSDLEIVTGAAKYEDLTARLREAIEEIKDL